MATRRTVCKHRTRLEEFESGGEGGIRTLGTLRYTRFPIVHLRPLGHLSAGGVHYTKGSMDVKGFFGAFRG